MTTLMRQNDEYGHRLAYRLAGEQLAQIINIEEQCRKSGAEYLPTAKAIQVKYLNQTYLVSLSGIKVSLPDKEADVPLRDQILILHYLVQAKGTALTNRMITYKELPEGAAYFPTFYQRAIKPLVNYFGQEPKRLLEVAKFLDGREADYGDIAVTINAFRRVPVTLVLWQGDQEFAPEGNILFDSTISDYLPPEDINVLCETIVWRLVKLLKAGGDNLGRNSR